ncbi:hypothetical protein STSO111631_10650 [Stackebrandtia soli]
MSPQEDQDGQSGEGGGRAVDVEHGDDVDGSGGRAGERHARQKAHRQDGGQEREDPAAQTIGHFGLHDRQERRHRHGARNADDDHEDDRGRQTLVPLWVVEDHEVDETEQDQSEAGQYPWRQAGAEPAGRQPTEDAADGLGRVEPAELDGPAAERVADEDDVQGAEYALSDLGDREDREDDEDDAIGCHGGDAFAKFAQHPRDGVAGGVALYFGAMPSGDEKDEPGGDGEGRDVDEDDAEQSAGDGDGTAEERPGEAGEVVVRGVQRVRRQQVFLVDDAGE